MIIKVLQVFLLFETKTVFDINWLTNITVGFYQSLALFQYEAMHSIVNFIFLLNIYIGFIDSSCERFQAGR